MSWMFNISAAASFNKFQNNQDPVNKEDARYYFANKSWSWWTNPLIKYDEASNTTYASVVNSGGHQEIFSINHSTGENKSVIINDVVEPKDEHNTAGILVRENDILWITANRNENPYWIGRVDKNLNILQAKTDVSSQTGTDRPCYAAIFDCAGKLFSFHRSNHQNWDFIYSNDAGVTWETKIRLISKESGNPSGWLYIMGQQIVGDKIKFLAYAGASQAESGQNKIVAFTLNASTGDVYIGQNLQGNVFNGGWSPMQFTSMPAVVDTTGDEKIRFSDMCGDGVETHIVVVDFLGSDFSQGNYRYLKINHDTLQVLEEIDIVPHGKDNGYPSYFGGIFFEKETLGGWSGILNLAREDLGTWYVEQYTYYGSSSSFTMTKLIDSVANQPGDIVMMRPQAPIDCVKGTDNIEVMYTKGDYLDDEFYDWSLQMIGAGGAKVNPSPEILFRESFYAYVTNTAIGLINWKAFKDNGENITNNSNQGLIASSKVGDASFPINSVHDTIGDTGYLAGISSRTKFFAFAETTIQNTISEVSWYQGHGNTNSATYFAVRIGTDWFIHSNGFNTITAKTGGSDFIANKELKEITVQGGNEWYSLNFNEGSTLNHSDTEISLPSGNITAVGLYTTGSFTLQTFRLEELIIK